MGLLLFVLPYLCSFFFLSRFLVKDISTTVLDRNFIFGIEVHNDKLYVELKMGLLLFVLPYICSFFCLSRIFVTDTSRYDKLYCEIANRHSPICSTFPFSFFSDFFSKISPQPFKIDTSNLVYRFTTTSCIVELKMGLLLFVLPYICSFYCLSRIFVKDISTTV